MITESAINTITWKPITLSDRELFEKTGENKEVSVEVLSVKETVKKEEAAELFKYL